MREITDGDLTQIRNDILGAYQSAIDAAGGHNSVATWLQQHPTTVSHLVGIGKAAAAMVAGALEQLSRPPTATLVITKTGHTDELDLNDPHLTCIESSHPVADGRALKAGRALREFFDQAPRNAQFLVCISGGASALVDDLAQGLDADFLSRMNQWLLASGLPIDSINRIRKRVSQLKAGRLARCSNGRKVTCLLISDVPDDDLKTIGSGLMIEHQPQDLEVSQFDLPQWLSVVSSQPPELAPANLFTSIETILVAKPSDACSAAAERLKAQGHQVLVHAEPLEGDAIRVGEWLVEEARREPGLFHIRSSETTVVLPQNPGHGGRCQALAMAAACQMHANENILVLAAGTDGTDGPGDVAGALVDPGSIPRGRSAGLDPLAHILTADAGSFLKASGDLLRTGPTGTNVMDLLISWHA